jgi:uncharacterized protein with HEPN domain
VTRYFSGTWSRVSKGFRAATPDFPWAAIIGMRNKVVHEYMNVDEEVVWKTATTEMEALLAGLRLLRGRRG